MNRRQMLTKVIASLAAAPLALLVPRVPDAPALRDLYLLTEDRTVLRKVRMAELKVGDTFLCFEGKKVLGTFVCEEAARRTYSGGNWTMTATVREV